MRAKLVKESQEFIEDIDTYKALSIGKFADPRLVDLSLHPSLKRLEKYGVTTAFLTTNGSGDDVYIISLHPSYYSSYTGRNIHIVAIAIIYDRYDGRWDFSSFDHKGEDIHWTHSENTGSRLGESWRNINKSILTDALKFKDELKSQDIDFEDYEDKSKKNTDSYKLVDSIINLWRTKNEQAENYYNLDK